MYLSDLMTRTLPPAPWSEGDNIPWHEPAFSARMLKEHLSQTHDAASRRFTKIDEQVAWIHHILLHERPTKILDLGCGPGFYTSRLATLGHTCVGIDYSPASIAFAKEQAQIHALNCRYELADVRTADFGTGYGLVMLIYGELNVFRRHDAKHVLKKAYAALADDGMLLLEPHTFTSIQQKGMQKPTWYTRERGLFADEPFLCLTEHFWHDAEQVATTRYYVIESTTGTLTHYAQSFQAYTDAGYRELLQTCGFIVSQFYPSLTGTADETQQGFCVIVGRKQPWDHLRENKRATH
jgi:SAM-dependent methyltransferase